MILRVLLAAVISAVLMMVWGFLFWGVFNVGGMIFEPVPLGAETSRVIKEMLPSTGMYVYPAPISMTDENAQTDFESKHSAGPLFRISYQAEGGPAMPTSKLVKGFLLNFIVALMAGFLTVMAGSSLPGFDKRFCFVFLLSLFATVWINVGDLIWWFHTPAYCLGNIAYGLGSGLVMGAVIGSLVSSPAIQKEESAQEA